MVPIGGEAPFILGILWMLFGVNSIFVLLRLYTRLKVVHAYGIDDYFFNAALVLQFIFCIVITVGAAYGLGQRATDIPSNSDLVTSFYLEAVGHDVVAFAGWISKLSLALFLLRIIPRRPARIAILVPAFILGILVCLTAAAWWQSIVKYRDIVPVLVVTRFALYVSISFAMTTILVDLFYAAFPWYLLWNLQMPRREKIMYLGPMSLGVLAAACGVQRLIIQSTIKTGSNYSPKSILIWQAAELTATMICIGIPVCRPLYKDWLMQTARFSSPDAAPPMLALETIGGSNRQVPNDRKMVALFSQDSTEKT